MDLFIARLKPCVVHLLCYEYFSGCSRPCIPKTCGQVSAISATQGRAKIDRSAIWKLTGQALMLHCILLRLAAHSAPSENTKLLVTDVGSLAQSLVNQSQRSVRGGAAHSAAHGPPNSASAFSWGGWILVAGLAAFARQFTKQLIPLWVKAWGKRVQQQTTDSNAGSNGSHGGSDSSPASVLKLTPAQAEAAAKDLVPAATAILCFCRRHRDYLASRSTSAQSLCNTLLKLLLTLRARICSVAVNQGGSGSGGGLLGGSAPNVGGAQSDSTLLYALVLGSLQLLPAKRYVPAHKQVLVDAVQLFADKALATTSLATTLVRSRDAAACPLEMVQPGSMSVFAGSWALFRSFDRCSRHLCDCVRRFPDFWRVYMQAMVCTHFTGAGSCWITPGRIAKHFRCTRRGFNAYACCDGPVCGSCPRLQRKLCARSQRRF